MTRLNWDTPSNPEYETGADRGVLYPPTGPGVVWNGLRNVGEIAPGVNQEAYYLDGKKFQEFLDEDSFQASLSAYTYPEPLDIYPGSQFGLTYRVMNESEYKVHIIYNALILEDSVAFQTMGNMIDTSDFKWDVYTSPLVIPGYRPSAHLIMDMRLVYPDVKEAIENILYGTSSTLPRLPLPAEISQLFYDLAIFKVTDHGDGSFTIEGPDEAVHMLDATTFELNWPSVILLSEDTYQASNY